jgi:hypothetical protein
MVALAKFFDWRDALAIVQPETFVGWQQTAFKMFWRWKSRKPGRPPLPKNLRELIGQMARENPTWGEQRIANELSLKLGIRVSPRTVGKYLGRDNPRGNSGQRWKTFVRNHAQAIVACDFFVSVTASFRRLYVFVAMEVGSRRILHANVTAHPTARMDDSAVPRISGVRSSLPVRHPRSRCHLLVRLGRGAKGLRCQSSADALSSNPGQCPLRTARWHHPAGVPRLPYPPIGVPPEADPSRVRPPLQ